MSNGSNDNLPEHVRGLPLEIQVAVLYERVGNLAAQVKRLIQWIATGVVTILGGIVIGLFSVAAGWVGPHAGPTHAAAQAVFGWIV